MCETISEEEADFKYDVMFVMVYKIHCQSTTQTRNL